MDLFRDLQLCNHFAIQNPFASKRQKALALAGLCSEYLHLEN